MSRRIFQRVLVFGWVITFGVACTTTRPEVDPLVQKAQTSAETAEANKGAILNVISQHSKDFTGCLQMEPQELVGSLLLSFEVEPELETLSVPANIMISENQTGSRSFGECILSKVMRWEFPKISTKVKVQYPVTIQNGFAEKAEPRNLAGSKEEKISVTEVVDEESSNKEWIHTF